MRLKKENLPQTDGKWLRNIFNWYSRLNGQTHNSLGPAIVHDDGSKEWLINGKLHRLDGPAIEWANGSEEWFIDGTRASEQNFRSAVISFLLGVDRETARIIEQEMKRDDD